MVLNRFENKQLAPMYGFVYCPEESLFSLFILLYTLLVFQSLVPLGNKIKARAQQFAEDQSEISMVKCLVSVVI